MLPETKRFAGEIEGQALAESSWEAKSSGKGRVRGITKPFGGINFRSQMEFRYDPIQKMFASRRWAQVYFSSFLN